MHQRNRNRFQTLEQFIEIFTEPINWVTVQFVGWAADGTAAERLQYRTHEYGESNKPRGQSSRTWAATDLKRINQLVTCRRRLRLFTRRVAYESWKRLAEVAFRDSHVEKKTITVQGFVNANVGARAAEVLT